jgi:hypothetical protein
MLSLRCDRNKKIKYMKNYWRKRKLTRKSKKKKIIARKVRAAFLLKPLFLKSNKKRFVARYT